MSCQNSLPIYPLLQTPNYQRQRFPHFSSHFVSSIECREVWKISSSDIIVNDNFPPLCQQ